MKNIFPLANYHKDYDERIRQAIEKQDESVVENVVSVEARKIYSMHRQVSCDIHKLVSFIRLKRSADILYSKVNTEHNILPFILKHFHLRFPTFKIIIGDKTTYIMDKEGKVSILNIDFDSYTKDLDSEDMLELWRVYYDSQYIEQRRNLGLMNKMMPKRLRQDNIETIISKRTRSLTEFM